MSASLPPRLAHLASYCVLSTFVPGWPRPKGSLETQAVRDGAGRLTGKTRVKDSAESTRWRRAVAQHLRRPGFVPLTCPVIVSCVFWFVPPSPADMRRPYPTGARIGDLDKLVRNVLDALQVDDTGKGNGADLIADDRQVVELVDTRKAWAPPDGSSGLGLQVWRVPV